MFEQAKQTSPITHRLEIGRFKATAEVLVLEGTDLVENVEAEVGVRRSGQAFQDTVRL